MSCENKDLLKIKMECKFIEEGESNYYVDVTDKIKEAAERMAKQIEELEEETKSRSQSEKMLVLMYNELKRDLAAAKPITCVECKYEPTCNCEVMTYAGKEILQNQRHEIAYCSRAERKEAE